MTTARITVILLIVVSLMTVAALSAVAQQDTSKTNQVGVAVIDVTRALNECQERKDIKINLERAGNKAKDEHEDYKRRIEDLKIRLEIGGEKDRKEVEGEIRKLAVEAKVTFEWREKEAIREVMVRTESLYNKMAKACQAEAEARGVKIVLFKSPARLVPSQNQRQLLNQIAARKVIWVADELDITDAVKQRMDNNWVVPAPPRPDQDKNGD